MISDTNGLLDAVRRQVGDQTAQILSLDRKGYEDGFADAVTGGNGVNRHSGIARTSSGEVEFKLVAKTCAEFSQGANPSSWLYWKREPLAYESGLLDALCGLAAPRCFGVTFPDQSTAVIYMEAVENDQTSWDFETYERAGRALGRFNGNNLNNPSAHRSWMAPSRAMCWVNEARSTLDMLMDLKGDPVVSRWLRGTLLERTYALWSDADVLLEAMRELPSCLCHHDAFRRNLMMQPDDHQDEAVVAIDWAFVGPGVVGEELAATVGVSLQFMEVEPEDTRRLEQSVFSGYVMGLRDAAWKGSEADARLGFVASTSLMLGLGALGPWLPLLRDPDFEPVVEKIVGVPKDCFIDRISELQDYFLDLGEEAVSSIRGIPDI